MKQYSPSLVAVLEPFIKDDRSYDIMRSLGFDHFLSNSDGSSKIWVFYKSQVQVSFVSSCSQGLTVLVNDGQFSSKMLATFVYASCSYQGRHLLWDYLHEVSNIEQHLPWSVMGDFNTMLSVSKKRGEVPSSISYG